MTRDHFAETGSGGGMDVFVRFGERTAERGRLASEAEEAFGRLFFGIAQQMREVVWIMSAVTGKLMYLSPAFEGAWGRSREGLEADPTSLCATVDPCDREIAQRFWSDARVLRRTEAIFRIRRGDGALRWLRVRSFPLADVDGEPLIGGIVADITEGKLAQQRRHDEEAAQRALLVREMHHRIKNSLQGVTGMLCRFAERHPELGEVVAEAMGRVHSIALIHGLQGRVGRVGLCELLASIVADARSLLQAPIRIDFSARAGRHAVVTENEAMPIALVLNELVFNAVKHRAGDGEVEVGLELDGSSGRATVTIFNCGRLAADGEARPAGGPGTGLGLVSALLPRLGASLMLDNVAEGVEVRLVLESPIITTFREASSDETGNGPVEMRPLAG